MQLDDKKKKITNDDANSTITSAFGFDESPKNKIIDFDGPEYKNSMELITNTISMENNRLRKNKANDQLKESPLYSEVVQDIIPNFLLPRYATEFLQFPITR